MKKNKAFTLIELISVLVILAILALIVTPLVLNIIKKARVAADKRSIDAYGRSIELAIADYLLDKGSFPTSIQELTIEYTGDKVECATTTISEDQSIYLAECTVAGRSVEGYTYGKGVIEYKSYDIGENIFYKDSRWYVVQNSTKSDDYVTLIKEKVLTKEELGNYAYCYSDEDECYNTVQFSKNGLSDYAASDIKLAIEEYMVNQGMENDLKEVGLDEIKYKIRLVTKDELINFSIVEQEFSRPWGNITRGLITENTPSWIYVDYGEDESGVNGYWTMSPDSNRIWGINKENQGSYLDALYTYYGNYGVRPVINLYKFAI